MKLSEDAQNVLLNAGSNIADEDQEFWPRVCSVLKLTIDVGVKVFDRDTRYVLGTVRHGAYSDANDPEFSMPAAAQFEVSVFDLAYDDPRAILAELRAITFDTDAEAAAFVLEFIWPWTPVRD